MCAFAAMLLASAGIATAAQGVAKPPLIIAEQGNFYVGGEEADTPSGKVVADAMYVEYQIPAERKHPYPLIFIHGGASTGSSFWSTPDGREGWATLFLRKGYAVYVVDRPTLGRSPHYEAVDGPKFMPPAGLPQREGRMVTPPPARPATRQPGANKPGDPAYEQMVRSKHSTVEVPFGSPSDPLTISIRVDTIDRNAGAALLDRIGPAILVTHSRAGTSGWQIADARPGLVKAIVAVEPNGPPFYNAPPLGQPGDAIARPFGLTYAPIEYAPPVKDAGDFGVLTLEPPADASKVGCWMPKVRQHKLVNLEKVPVMVLTGGSSYHAAYDYCTATFLARVGVPVERVALEERGIAGNTHGLPTEANNGEIADLVSEWLTKGGL